MVQQLGSSAKALGLQRSEMRTPSVFDQDTQFGKWIFYVTNLLKAFCVLLAVACWNAWMQSAIRR